MCDHAAGARFLIGHEMQGAIRAICGAALVVAAVSVPSLESHGQSATTRRSAQVYLLRGFANLSPGLDGLGERLQKLGFHASVHNHLVADGLAPEIEQNYRRGQTQIILIGHSLGASAAASLAELLGRSRIPVRLLVTIDPVTQLVTPRNVGRHLNHFVSDGVGVSATRPSKPGKVLVNRDYKGNADIGHFSITTSERVQRQIVRDVLAAGG
jgi:pimeloyl-ACP methyl ester carboxylesterase